MILCTQIEDVFLKENSGTVKHPTLPITPLPPQNYHPIPLISNHLKGAPSFHTPL